MYIFHILIICTLHIGATYSPFGEGSGPILMYTRCYSPGNSLSDCYSQPQYIPGRRHENDLGVRCESKGLLVAIDFNCDYMQLLVKMVTSD